MIDLSDISTEELAAEIGRRARDQKVNVSSSPQDTEILSITRSVAGIFGIPMESILGQSRKLPTAQARFGAWLVLRSRGFLPHQIAPVFWRKDTGTVRHGCIRGRALIQTDRRFARLMKVALDLVSSNYSKEDAA